MARLDPILARTLINEGGYSLHEVKGDRGGRTYAGIASRFHPDWPGWAHIDRGEIEAGTLQRLVRLFYEAHFWEQLKGEMIKEEAVAATLFDFAVNTGVVTAVRLAQGVLGTPVDGVMGPKTLTALNAQQGDLFIAAYTLAKIARYARICNRNRTQTRFLLGWINRSLKGVA